MNPQKNGLKELKLAMNLSDFAKLIDSDPEKLSFILYKIPESKKYTKDFIPKKGGGNREIYSPIGPLKSNQKKTAQLLSRCESEIQNLLKIENSVSHGYKQGHSILSNANVHRNQKYVLNLDLKDFFGSINFGRIYGYLIKNKHYKLNKNVARVIAHMACYEGKLVQGSPLSPVISNIVGNILDSRLLKLCQTHRCRYSRYVDDITISTHQSIFPERLALENLCGTPPWTIGVELSKVIENCDFKINSGKTRMHLNKSRQSVTSLTVNKIPNIERKKYKQIQAMTNSYVRTGKYTNFDGDDGSTLSLRGYLDYCFWIKKNNGYFNKDNSNFFLKKNEKESRKLTRLSFEWVFYKFLFSLNFIHNTSPTLIFEGETDYIYFKEARKSKTTKSKIKSNLNFLNLTRTVKDILKLKGGTGHLAPFIASYSKTMNGYSKLTPQNPVILILDNDKGLGSLQANFKSLIKLEIKDLKAKKFFPITDNLYVVLTPIGNGFPDKDSWIEHLFENDVLSKKIRGKTFNPNLKQNEDTLTYGKGIFAREVIAARSKAIDFKKFDLIFDSVQLVMDDYSKKLAELNN